MHEVWIELQQRADLAPVDADIERQWLSEFAARLPWPAVHRRWEAFAAANPPDFVNYAAWLKAAETAARTKPLAEPKASAPAEPKPKVDWRRDVAPKMWAELHSRPNLPTFDPAAEAEWLKRFTARVECGPCRNNWKALQKKAPPDLSSPAAYARWIWRAHNTANGHAGKPAMEWEAARALHDWPT